MKIAEVVCAFPPHPGGMGIVCFHNAQVLAGRGHDVTVFTLDPGRRGGENDPPGFRIVRLDPFVRSGDGAIVPSLYAKLRDFEIVHLHYPFFGAAEYVYLSSLLRKQPYFLTYHMDVFGDTFAQRAFIGMYEPLLMKKILRRAARIGAVSIPHLRSSKAGSLVDWERVVEMPNGVDTELFSPREKKQELILHYGLEGKTIALFVGNFKSFKGFDLLIEAMSQMQDERFVLVAVGGGYCEEAYKKEVAKRKLNDRIIFVGPRHHDIDLPDFYSLADFLVLPSISSESFGLVVLEAMACGKPVIVSSLPGPSLLVEEGADGFIVQAGDVTDLKNKMLLLAGSSQLRSQMGAAGRKKVVAGYSWQRSGKRLEEEFRSILAGASCKGDCEE